MRWLDLNYGLSRAAEFLLTQKFQVIDGNILKKKFGQFAPGEDGTGTTAAAADATKYVFSSYFLSSCFITFLQVSLFIFLCGWELGFYIVNREKIFHI